MFHQHDPSLSLYRIDDLCFKIYDFSFLLKIFAVLGFRMLRDIKIFVIWQGRHL